MVVLVNKEGGLMAQRGTVDGRRSHMIEMDAVDSQAVASAGGLSGPQGPGTDVQAGSYPVPTYVGSSCWAGYCAGTNEEEIEEGIQVVQRQLATAPSAPGEEEFFKSKAGRARAQSR